MHQDKIFIKTADTLGINFKYTKAAALLFEEGATIPFIARYRKEATGGMDEVALKKLQETIAYLKELEERKSTIIKSLEERGLLNEKLKNTLLSAENRTELEDIYLPYRPKRRTRASAARNAGLQGLAEYLLNNQNSTLPYKVIEKYINHDKGINTEEEALSGARDIIAEIISEDTVSRSRLRNKLFSEGILSSKVVKSKAEEKEALVYKDYFEYSEPVRKIPPHRFLAVLRGNKEGFLKITVSIDSSAAAELLERKFIKGRAKAALQIKKALEDSWKRLIAPSLENDVLKELKEKSDKKSIEIFSRNLKAMLLAPPLGAKTVLAVDPGFRTGGKTVVISATGKLLFHTVIYPAGSAEAVKNAAETLKKTAGKYSIEVIAVGNGTAGRETAAFIKKVLPGYPVIPVDERGASVYSASEEARKEFGNLDITVRGAVSIGRRLQDPLAELVKIPPESIGVGQYQHDVDNKALKNALNETVVSAVNAVGVEINTASAALLSAVSGLNRNTAEKIIKYRDSKGRIKSRKELLEIPGIGEKTFALCAGFLRIRNAQNPLDSSAVHPERYALVEKMASDLKTDVKNLIESAELRKKIRAERYIDTELSESEEIGRKTGYPGNNIISDGNAAYGGFDKPAAAGLPTILDILKELEKPGLDPRGSYEIFNFRDGINTLEDLEEGMQLPGIVTNVTAFGAFVDVGVHRDGLVHISRIAEKYVSDPSEILAPGDQVNVKVLSVDPERKRLNLSIKDAKQKPL